MTFLKFDSPFSGKSLCLFICPDGLKINAGFFLDGIFHGQAAERLTQINLLACPILFISIINGCASTDLLRQITEHTLCQLHHTIIVCVCLIQFHQGEFRIMSLIKAFIPENTSDLVYPLQSSDNQTLQVQFERNPKFFIFAKSIIMSDKRTSRCSSGIVYQHRSLDLHKAPAVQEIPDLSDNLGSLDKRLFYILIHNQVDISLAVADICVDQTMELLRERLQRFGQQCHLLRMNRDFPRLRLKYIALHADDIADIHALEFFIGFISQRISLHITLNGTQFILNMTEGSFSHDTLAHDAACNGNFPAVHLLKMFHDFPAVAGLIVFRNDKRILSRRLQLRQLFSAHFQHLIQILRRFPASLLLLTAVLLFCHGYPPSSKIYLCVI